MAALRERVVLRQAHVVANQWRDGVCIKQADAWNVITTAGIDFLFAQGYSAAPGGNGLNYIANSPDAVTETSASTTLSGEIVGNGLERTQGVYAHTPGASTATISYTFTASGPEDVQKSALFSAGAAGTMNHVIGYGVTFAMLSGDQLVVVYTITLVGA